MECKEGLTETEGDIKKAEELLRIKSGAKASKAASRQAAEGIDRRLRRSGRIGRRAGRVQLRNRLCRS